MNKFPFSSHALNIFYVRSWLLQYMLKLNDTKTEFLIIGTGREISKLDVLGIKVGNSIVIVRGQLSTFGGPVVIS